MRVSLSQVAAVFSRVVAVLSRVVAVLSRVDVLLSRVDCIDMCLLIHEKVSAEKTNYK